MIPRAILDLGQLADERLHDELARGMRLSLTNALRLWREAQLLRKHRRAQGFQILKLLVEEEAAKFHILLDAARCPRLPVERFNRHLRYFVDHLARGLYTEYYQWTQMDLREAVTYIDRERQTLYLDGYDGVEWIFRNSIEQRREEAIYVDYVAVRDHFHDEHTWHCPNPRLLGMYFQGYPPNVLRVALALHHVGLTKPNAVRLVAELWQREAPNPETMSWTENRALNLHTLEALATQGLLRTSTETDQSMMVNEWRPPLYPLDLRRSIVEPADLRAAQEAWVPDYY